MRSERAAVVGARALVGALLATAACSSPESYIVLTLSSATVAPISNVANLKVDVASGGHTRTLVYDALGMSIDQTTKKTLSVGISGSESGTVTFTEVADGVQVHAEITGLTPGNHGFHVHEFGDCTAEDGSSAGGHFNPTNQPHGGPDADARHVGDMGNIEADASGTAKLDYLDHSMSLSNDDRSIIGRSVVVHAKADDLKSQPAGDSGARIACGVIGRAKSQ